MAGRSPEAKARARAGKKLSAAIKRLKLSNGEVAEACGIDIDAVEGLGWRAPHLRTIDKVASYVQAVARSRRDRSPST